MAAWWLLQTPLGAPYFNLSWALVSRHPRLLRDEGQAKGKLLHFALPISTWLIRYCPNSAPDAAANRASQRATKDEERSRRDQGEADG
jgi:hypothetical protein